MLNKNLSVDKIESSDELKDVKKEITKYKI